MTTLSKGVTFNFNRLISLTIFRLISQRAEQILKDVFDYKICHVYFKNYCFSSPFTIYRYAIIKVMYVWNGRTMFEWKLN